LEGAANQYGLEVPRADLFFWGTDEARLADIKAAINVGPSWIDGVLCDHYAIRPADVDWQLWIERSATPRAPQVRHHYHMFRLHRDYADHGDDWCVSM
jgi:hypothetical protein